MPTRIWYPRIRKGSRTHHASSLVTHAGTFEEGGQNVALVLTPKNNGDNGPTMLRDKKAAVVSVTGDNKQQLLIGEEGNENDPKKEHSPDMPAFKTSCLITQPVVQDSTAIGREVSQLMNELSNLTKNFTEKKGGVSSFFGSSKKDKSLDHIVSTQSKIEVDLNEGGMDSTLESPLIATKTQTGKRHDNCYSKQHHITSTVSEIEVEWKPVGAKQRKPKTFTFQGNKKVDNVHRNNIPPATEKNSFWAKDCVDSTEETMKLTESSSIVSSLATTNDFSSVRDAVAIVPTESKIEIGWESSEEAQNAMINNATPPHKKSSSAISRKTGIKSTQSRVEVSRKQDMLSKRSKQGLSFLLSLLESAKGTPEIDQLTEIITNHSKIEAALKTESPNESAADETLKTKLESKADTKSPSSKLDPRAEVFFQTQSKAKGDWDEGISISKQMSAGFDWRKGLLELIRIVQPGAGPSQSKDLSQIISTHSKIEVDWKDSPSQNVRKEEVDRQPHTSWRDGQKTSRLEPEEEEILSTESKIEVNLSEQSTRAHQSKGSSGGSEWRKGLLHLIRMVESGLKSSEIEKNFSQIIATQSKIEIHWNPSKKKLDSFPRGDWKAPLRAEAAIAPKVVSTLSKPEVGCDDAATNDEATDACCYDAATNDIATDACCSTEKSVAKVRISIVPSENAAKTTGEQPPQDPSILSKLHEGVCEQKQPVHSSIESRSQPETSAIDSKLKAEWMKGATASVDVLSFDQRTTTKLQNEFPSISTAGSHPVESPFKTQNPPKTQSGEEAGPSLSLPGKIRSQPCVIAGQLSEQHCKFEPYTTVGQQLNCQETVSSNKNTRKDEHCTPKESTGWKEEILSTLAFIASPKMTHNMELMKQEPKEVSDKMESLIALGVDDSESIKDLAENMSSDEKACKDEHCTPKESTVWKAEILSTLAYRYITSPTTIHNIESMKQEPKEASGEKKSLIILGGDYSESMEKLPQAPQPMPEQKVDTVSRVEEARANLVLSSASVFESNERSCRVPGHINGSRDTTGETDNQKEFKRQKSAKVRKLWNITSPERQEKWLAALNAAIESTQQQQAMVDENTVGILSEMIQESAMEVDGAAAEHKGQHQDDDDEASISSLDLLWHWLTCRKLDLHQKQGADLHGKAINNEAEDLDMLIDILADKQSADASIEDATEFPFPPGEGNPISPKKKRTNSDLRFVNTI